jgi:hypothetical protein
MIPKHKLVFEIQKLRSENSEIKEKHYLAVQTLEIVSNELDCLVKPIIKHVISDVLKKLR